jgi:small subunit ribosomal protein S4
MPGKSTIKHKVCRALGVNIIGSPSAALTLSRRPNRPGQHGANRRQKVSPFGLQLQETQKLKYFYGISKKQLRRYYERASSSKVQTNIALVQMMETRLDNMVYRMGFTGTLRAARQMVVHCHITVNGKKAAKPGFELRPGDVVALREKSQKVDTYKNWFGFYEQKLDYVERDASKLSAKLVRIPDREEIPIQVEDHLVVEFMARG